IWGIGYILNPSFHYNKLPLIYRNFRQEVNWLQMSTRIVIGIAAFIILGLSLVGYNYLNIHNSRLYEEGQNKIEHLQNYKSSYEQQKEANLKLQKQLEEMNDTI